MCRNLLLVLAVSFGSATISSLAADEGAENKQTDRAAAKVQNLDLRYAEIVEQIAGLNLRKARESNARVPGTVADTDLQRLSENLRLARREVEQLKQSPQAGSTDERLREARARANLAEAELRKARSANQRLPGTVPDLEVERLKLELEAAQINVVRQQAAADVPSALAEMRQQISDMRKEIAQLKRQLNQVAEKRPPAQRDEVRTAADLRN
jgi:hypothetical protein